MRSTTMDRKPCARWGGRGKKGEEKSGGGKEPYTKIPFPSLFAQAGKSKRVYIYIYFYFIFWGLITDQTKMSEKCWKIRVGTTAHGTNIVCTLLSNKRRKRGF